MERIDVYSQIFLAKYKGSQILESVIPWPSYTPLQVSRGLCPPKLASLVIRVAPILQIEKDTSLARTVFMSFATSRKRAFNAL